MDDVKVTMVTVEESKGDAIDILINILLPSSPPPPLPFLLFLLPLPPPLLSLGSWRGREGS